MSSQTRFWNNKLTVSTVCGGSLQVLHINFVDFVQVSWLDRCKYEPIAAFCFCFFLCWSGVCFAPWKTMTQQRKFLRSWLKLSLADPRNATKLSRNMLWQRKVTVAQILQGLLCFHWWSSAGALSPHLSAVLIGWYEGHVGFCLAVCFCNFRLFQTTCLCLREWI